MAGDEINRAGDHSLIDQFLQSRFDRLQLLLVEASRGRFFGLRPLEDDAVKRNARKTQLLFSAWFAPFVRYIPSPGNLLIALN